MRTTIIKSVAPIVGLLLGSSRALDVYPAAGAAWPTSPALAAGVAHAKLVPFDVDYTAQPNYETDKVLGQYSSAVWDAGVAVYDSDAAFGSLPSLTWQVGKGPGRPNTTLANPWNACVIALPQLLDVLNIKARGDGSCFDVVNKECLYSIVSSSMSIFQDLLSQVDSISPDFVAKACRQASLIPLISKCFSQPSPTVSSIQGYSTANPPNGQPLLIGLDSYDASNKAATQATAVSRTWPLLILEAQGNYTIQGVVTCPSAHMNNDASKSITSSPDGTCGGTLRYKCQDTKFFYGNCCGADGYCGYSPNECATGCQSKYGLCDTVVTVTSTKSSVVTTTISASGSQPTTSPTATPVVFKDNFDGNFDRWSIYGGSYIDVSGAGVLLGSSSSGGKAVVKNMNASDVRVTANVTIFSPHDGNAGLIFRVSSASEGVDSYNGYYAGIGADGYVVLGRADQGWTELKRVSIPVATAKAHRISVDAIGDQISVTVDNADKPQIEVRDGTYASGSAGVRVFNTDTLYNNFTVAPVVALDFAQGNLNRWTQYGPSSVAKVVLKDASFDDFSYEADVTLNNSQGNAGLIFRVANAQDGADGYDGYYAGIGTDGFVVLGRVSQNWNELQYVKTRITAGSTYRFKVTAQGSSINVFINDMGNPKITVTDSTYKSGTIGVRVFQAAANFNNIIVARL